MDPLSITASTLTLLQAVGTVTTALGTVIHELRTVDARLTGLCDELSDLQGHLRAIDDAVKSCKHFDLNLVNGALWTQSEIALTNCQATVDELALVVDKIKNSSRQGKLVWKVGTMMYMKIHQEELVSFREKIHQSNLALQTMLHIIVVSLSLRQNTSQDQMMTELQRLKQSINKAWTTSSKPTGRSRHRKTAVRNANNLKRLAAAAENFYTAASSTAGTLPSDGSQAHFGSMIDSQAGRAGVFPYSRYQRVEQFVDNVRAGCSDIASCRAILRSTKASNSATQLGLSFAAPMESVDEEMSVTSPTLEANAHEENENQNENEEQEEEEEEDEDAYLENCVLDGMRELAIASIKARDFPKATYMIKGVIFSEFGTTRGKYGHRALYSQLILCHLFQRQWDLAEPLVKLMIDSRVSETDVHDELIVYNFSHALALCYLGEFDIARALETCKQALHGKRKLCRSGIADWSEYYETLGLFATIYEVSGDCVRAEIFRRQLPSDFNYSHPADEIVFIQTHKDLLSSIIGSDNIQLVMESVTIDTPVSPTTPVDAVIPECALRLKLTQHEKYELDTSKEVVIYEPDLEYQAEDELSTTLTNQTDAQVPKLHSPIRRRLTRMFGRRSFRRGIDGRHSTPWENATTETSSPTRMRKFRNTTMSQIKTHMALRSRKAEPERKLQVPDVSPLTAGPEVPAFLLPTPSLSPCEGETSEEEMNDAAQDWLETPTQCFDFRIESVAESLPGINCDDIEWPLAPIASTAPKLCDPQIFHVLPENPEAFSFSFKEFQPLEPDVDSLMISETTETVSTILSSPEGPHNSSDSDSSVSQGSSNDSSQPAQSLNSSSRSRPHSLENLPQNLEIVIHKLTMTLTSIHKIKDLESLLAKERALMDIYPDLETLSRDPSIVKDTRAVMLSLRKRIKKFERIYDDSGYESKPSSQDMVKAKSGQRVQKGNKKFKKASATKNEVLSIRIPQKNRAAPVVKVDVPESSSRGQQGDQPTRKARSNLAPTETVPTGQLHTLTGNQDTIKGSKEKKKVKFDDNTQPLGRKNEAESVIEDRFASSHETIGDTKVQGDASRDTSSLSMLDVPICLSA